MYHENDFVVTHEFSLRFKQLPFYRYGVEPATDKHESKELTAAAAGFFLLYQ